MANSAQTTENDLQEKKGNKIKISQSVVKHFYFLTFAIRICRLGRKKSSRKSTQSHNSKKIISRKVVKRKGKVVKKGKSE